MANINTEPFLGGKVIRPVDWANKLITHIQKSDERLDKFRKSRENMLQRYVGEHYGGVKNAENLKASPLNMIRMSANIYIPLMVMYSPRYRVRTALQGHKGTAWLIENDLNKTVKEMRLRDVLEKATIDSLFMMGIVKTGFGHGRRVSLADLIGPMPEEIREKLDKTIEIPEVFIKRISPDDYIVDPQAKDQSEIQFEGDQYEVPLEVAKQWFPDAKLEKDPTRGRSNRRGAETLSSPQYGGERLFDTVTLVDMYFPMYNLVHTFARYQPDAGILNEAEYDGKDGPYHKLRYHDVPDQVLPSAPAEAWISLNDLLNDLSRSIRRAVQRAKTVGVYGINAGEDGDRLQKARDGDFVGVQNPELVNQISLGGNTQALEATLGRFIRIFSMQSGNTSLLGGMNADARSATEASMLGQNASMRINFMQNKVEQFAGQIGDTIARLRWYDPFAERTMAYPLDIKGAHIELEARYSPETKTGNYEDYDLEVVPYSMRGRNPEDYARRILEWWNSVVLPTAEVAMQQGAHLDVQGMAKFIAEEMGIRQADWWYRKGREVSPADTKDMSPTQEGGRDGKMQEIDRGRRQSQTNMPKEIQEMMEHREVR